MKKILSYTWKAVRYNLGDLLLFETGYRILTFFLAMQMIDHAIDFSLKQQAFSYLTAENYGEFIKSPWTILLFTGILALLLLFFLTEAAALLWGFRHSASKRKLYASDFLIEGIKGVFYFLRQGKLAWIFWAVLALPFLAAYFLIQEASYVGLLEFTGRKIYETVQPHGLLYALIIVLLLVSLCSVFALPYCFFEKEKSARGIRRGLELFRQHWREILTGFLILYAGIAVISAVFYLLAAIGVTGAVMQFKPEEGKITSILIYKEYIQMAMGVLAGGIQMTGSMAFVYTVYSRFRREKAEEVSLCSQTRNYTWLSQIGKRKGAAFLTLLFIGIEGCYLGVMAASHDTVLESLNANAQITAHRGGALRAPENTLSALSYTWECGADFAEIDVQETKDGQLILLHDESLKRITGLDKNVWEMTYEEIEDLDAGSSFGEKYQGEKIPTLEEVLNFCFGRLDLNIEIKYNGKNEGIVQKVVQVIRDNNFQEHCAVTSMNYQFLEQIKASAPEIRTGYIMTMSYGSISQVAAADFFSIRYDYVTENFVKEAHALGKEVHAWTVNYRGNVKRMLDIGVDNIITDDPALVRKVQNQESGTRTDFSELLKYALGI